MRMRHGSRAAGGMLRCTLCRRAWTNRRARLLLPCNDKTLVCIWLRGKICVRQLMLCDFANVENASVLLHSEGTGNLRRANSREKRETSGNRAT